MARVADPHRREDILRAARAVFLANGYVQARVADIAAQAGIAMGTLYLYFPSKDAIAAALVDDYFARVDALIEPLLPSLGSAEGIASGIHTVLSFTASERDILRLLPAETFNCEESQPFSPARRQMHQMLTQSLAVGMEQGRIRQYDPAVLAELIDGMITWVIEACLLRGDGDLPRYEQTLVRLLQVALLTDR